MTGINVSKDIIVHAVTPDGMAGYCKDGKFWVGYDRDGYGEIGFYCSSSIHNVAGKTCVLCDRAWEPSVNSIIDQVFDEDALTYLHRSCYERHLGFLERRGQFLIHAHGTEKAKAYIVWTVEVLKKLETDLKEVIAENVQT